MNKDKRNKSKESTPNHEEEEEQGNNLDGQLKSQRQSEGPESSVSSGRRRPSSWDDSDDDLPIETINHCSVNGRIYSGGSRKSAESIAAEINEIKTQYFRNLNAVGGLPEIENVNFHAKPWKNVAERKEVKSKFEASDRRQSPARIRRRTKSSSSSSPVLEPLIDYSGAEFKENFQFLVPESYQCKNQSFKLDNSSLKSEFESDSKYFLDNFFNELRMKRIELVGLGEETSLGNKSRDETLSDFENHSGANIDILKTRDFTRNFSSVKCNPDLKTLESFEGEESLAYVHKTSRKLSQILEVEETKKSYEGINLSGEEEEGGVKLFEMSPFLWANPHKPLMDDETSPLPTSRLSSDEGENASCWNSILSLREKAISPPAVTDQPVPNKSASLEKLRNEEEKSENSTKGSLSERFHNLFRYNDSDEIIFLTAKTGQIQLNPNSERENEGNNDESFKNDEEAKLPDEPEREAILGGLKETDFERNQKADVIENPSLGKSATCSDTRRKNSSHKLAMKSPRFKIDLEEESFRSVQSGLLKTQDSNERKISQKSEERSSDPAEGTIFSSSECSTPRKSSCTSCGSRKSSEHLEMEAEYQLPTQDSNRQSRRLTLETLKLETTPVHSSRETSKSNSFRSKKVSSKPTSGDMRKGSSQKTYYNLPSETAEEKSNFLKINLEKISSDSSTSISNSSSSRTAEEIKDSCFPKSSSGRNPHTPESTGNQSPKKLKNYSHEASDFNNSEIREKFQKLSSRSLKSSEAVRGNFERKTKSSDGDVLTTLKKQKSKENSERSSTSKGKVKATSNVLPTNTCTSANSNGTMVHLAEPKDLDERLENPEMSRHDQKHKSYNHVDLMTFESINTEKTNSSRSEKTWTKRWRSIKSSGKSEDGAKVSQDGSVPPRDSLSHRERIGETKQFEDFKRNFLSSKNKDEMQNMENEKDKRNDGTPRHSVTMEKLLDDTMTIEESEKCLDDEKSFFPSSAHDRDKELEIFLEDLSLDLEKTDIHSKPSSRESEKNSIYMSDQERKLEVEENSESYRSRIITGNGRMCNNNLSIINETTSDFKNKCPEIVDSEKWEANTLKFQRRPSPERIVTSSRSSEASQKKISDNISEPTSYRHPRIERSQNPKEEFEEKETKASFEESMAPETFLQNKFDGEAWSSLIDAFEGTRNSVGSPDNKFPGFRSLNQKEFPKYERKETQDFFFYVPNDMNESEDIFNLSRRLIDEKNKLCSRSPKDEEFKGDKSKILEGPDSSPQNPETRKLMFKSNEEVEKSVHEWNLKRENFEIGEFGDGNCWHDGELDISELDKPKHHGDGNKERKNRWGTLVLRIEENKEEKEMRSGKQLCMEFESKSPGLKPSKNESFSEKEHNVDLESIHISRNVSHSKSESCISRKKKEANEWKMLSQRKTKGDEKCGGSQSCKTLEDLTVSKESSKRKRYANLVSNSRTKDRLSSEDEEKEGEGFYVEKDYWLGGGSPCSDESRLLDERNSTKNFDRSDREIPETAVKNRKEEKDSTNVNIFFAERKKEKETDKANNWLIIKNQEGKQSKQQKEKIRKLKIKLKKGEKMSLSKEPLCANEILTGKPRPFVPPLKFGNSSCLQNFYKRLFSICCLTPNSSAATSV